MHVPCRTGLALETQLKQSLAASSAGKAPLRQGWPCPRASKLARQKPPNYRGTFEGELCLSSPPQELRDSKHLSQFFSKVWRLRLQTIVLSTTLRYGFLTAALMVVVVPVAVLVKVVVPRHVMIVIAVPVEAAGMVVPMARVVPHMMTTPMSVVIRPMAAMVTIVPPMPPTVTMRIADIDVHASGGEVNSLGMGVVQTDPHETDGKYHRPSDTEALHFVPPHNTFVKLFWCGVAACPWSASDQSPKACQLMDNRRKSAVIADFAAWLPPGTTSASSNR